MTISARRGTSLGGGYLEISGRHPNCRVADKPLGDRRMMKIGQRFSPTDFYVFAEVQWVKSHGPEGYAVVSKLHHRVQLEVKLLLQVYLATPVGALLWVNALTGALIEPVGAAGR